MKAMEGILLLMDEIVQRTGSGDSGALLKETTHPAGGS